MKHALRPEPKVNQTTIENTMNLGQIQVTQKFIIKHPCTYQTTKIECLCFSPKFPHGILWAPPCPGFQVPAPNLW